MDTSHCWRWFSFLLLALPFLALPLIAAAGAEVPFSALHPQYAAALSLALAQEVDGATAPSNIDEDFAPEDFGLERVGLLPSNPLYVFKAARRGFSDAFTTDPIEKVENSLRFAAERLLEAEALALRGSREGSIASALNGFRREVERVKERAEVAQAELGSTDEGRALATKMMDAVLKYEKMIGRVERGTTGRAVGAATEAKGQAAEALGTAFSLIPPDEGASAFAGVLDAQRGSALKDFKNIEVLKAVEDRVPESARAAVQAAKEGALARLEEGLTAEAGSRSALGDYVRTTGGNEVHHLEIIQELEVRPLSDEARTALLSAKEEVFARAEGRLALSGAEEKKALLAHLGEGALSDVRVVKELEKNISAEKLGEASEVAAAAKRNFARKVEVAASDVGARAKLLESVERFHDAKALSVLDEIAALIPPEQQSVFISLKARAVEEIQKDVARARDTAAVQSLYRSLGGDHPEEFKTIESIGIGEGIIEGIRNATAELVKARANLIKDEARFGKYEEALRVADSGVSGADLSAFFAERRVVYGSREKAEAKIAEVKGVVDSLAGLVATLPLGVGAGEAGFDQRVRDAARLLNSAERRLAAATDALLRQEFGFAYSEAQEAEFAARDGSAIARAYKSGSRLSEKEEKKEEARKEQGDFSCQAYFEGFVYDEAAGSCGKRSASGCSDPFVYKTREACEAGATKKTDPNQGRVRWVEHTWKFQDGVETSFVLDRTDSEYLRYIRNIEAQCRLMPKQQFVWMSGAGNDSADNWKNFGIPDCSGRAFAPATCGNAICELGETVANCAKDCTTGTRARDAYSCPGFAHERIDSTGAKYCKMNTREACSYAYPQFLYESSYSVAQCPTADTTGGTATTTRQFGNCAVHTSGGECEADTACDWYVPPRGSPYCSLAVRGTWVSHVWKFSDGGTETSSILGRQDREYSEFIASVDAQCKTITRDKFAWKAGAGDDRAENWQNFGIPDCSGTATNTNTGGSGYAGDANSCPSFAYSKWDKDGKRYCQLNNERKCDYNYPSYLTNGPNYKVENCPTEGSTSTTATTTSQGGSGTGTSGVPAKPMGLTATLSGNAVELRWSDGPAGTPAEGKFKIWRSVNGSWAFLVESPYVSSGQGVYNDNSPPSGNIVYQVQACNASGCSPDSNTATVWVGSSGGTTNTTTTGTSGTSGASGTSGTSSGGGTTGSGGSSGSASSMSRCFYPNASINGAHPGYTVWCERDYYNCRKGSQSGETVSLTNLMLGAPSSCESGWSSGSSGGSGSSSGGTDVFNTQSGCSAANGTWSGSYCTCPSGTYYSNGFCTSSGSGSSGGSYNSGCSSSEYWDSSSQTCKPMSSGGSSGGSTSCGSGMYWNGSACVSSSSGASIWQAFRNWLAGE